MLQSVDLSDLEKAKLESCLEQIKTTLLPLNMPKNELVNIIISMKFNMEKISNDLRLKSRDKGEPLISAQILFKIYFSFL